MNDEKCDLIKQMVDYDRARIDELVLISAKLSQIAESQSETIRNQERRIIKIESIPSSIINIAVTAVITAIITAIVAYFGRG